MRKKTLWLSAIALVLILSVFGLTNLLPHHFLEMKANWDISLPVLARLNLTYEKESPPAFGGDGIRYYVYSCQDETSIDTMFAWLPTEDDTLSQTAQTWLDEIEVPEQERPDYAQCLHWYTVSDTDDRDTLLVFWDSEENRLSLIEYCM